MNPGDGVHDGAQGAGQGHDPRVAAPQGRGPPTIADGWSRDLELHGARSIEGITARVGQRILALTAAIWHNHATGQLITRSLIAFDH